MNELTEVSVNQQALSIEEQAQAVQITNNAQYESAAEMLKQIKAAKKQVEDYWKEPIQKAFEAHRALTSKKSAMTNICDSAEKILKGKMLTYSQNIESERRAAEEAARKAAQEEADRLLAEAAKAEESGDTMQATVNMAMAEQMASIKPAVQVVAPKVSGVSTKKVWKVKITDEKSVPSYVAGICIRPVDEKALLQLRKLNPNVEIAGVSFYQDSTLAVR